MKLIVAGASGFVATEVIRQSLSIPRITSVIAIARRPVATPSNLSKGADASKLHSVVLDSYGTYPDDVIKQLAGADACIWYIRSCSCLLLLPLTKLKLHLLGPSRLHPVSRAGSTLMKYAACARSTRSSGFKPCSRRAAKVVPHLFASCT